MSAVQTDIQIDHTQCDIDGQLRRIQSGRTTAPRELDQLDEQFATVGFHFVGRSAHVSVSSMIAFYFNAKKTLIFSDYCCRTQIGNQ